MKKIIVLTMIFVLLSSVFVFANSNNEKLNFTTVVDFEKSQQNFYDIFRISPENEFDKQNIDIQYDYNLADIDEDFTQINMSGYLNVNGKKYSFDAKGEIEKAGKGLFYGPIDGKININNSPYNLIMGFDKKDSNEFITMTIYNEKLQTVLVFGMPVVSIEEKDSIAKSKMKNSKDKSRRVASFSKEREGAHYIRDFDYNTYVKGDLETGGYTGIQLSLYKSDYDKTSKALQVRVKSYIDYIDRKIKKNNPYHESVALTKIKVALEMDIGSCNNTSPSDSDEGSGILKSMILDALGYFKVPTWLCDAIFSNSRGRITVKDDAYDPAITIKATSGGTIDCDSDDLPLFFTVSSNRHDRVTGEMIGTLTYKITSYTPRVGRFSFYSEADASKKFDVTF